MNPKRIILAFSFSIAFGGSLFSQQNTLATGGEATGPGGAVSFSVGQIDYTSQSGTSGSINQGVQQPLEFFNVGVDDKTNTFAFLIYPNPVVAELNVELKDISLNQLSFVLTDVSGKIIETFAITQNKFTINMVDLNHANYFLNFVKQGTVVGSYQIVKK